jgi:hypothetical protein
MPNFPALVPADAVITPGAIPATVVEGYDGSTVTTTADTMATGDTLTLPFQNLTEAEVNSVRSHQRDQQGRPFAFDAITLASSLSLPGYAWVYAADPQQEDIRSVAGSELYFLTCSFRAVRVRVPLPPTATSRIVLRAYPARALPAGPPGANSIIGLTPTAAGVVTTPPGDRSFLLLKPTAANVISTPLNDPLYGSVILHLPLTSAAEFTDVSGRSSSITPQGNTAIDAAEGRWGGGSVFFDGTGDWLTVALAAEVGAGPYTIRFWFRPSSINNNGLFSFANSDNTRGGLNAGIFQSGNRFITFSNGPSTFTNNLTACPDVNQWGFFQQTRDSANSVVTSITVQGGATSFDPGFSGTNPNPPRIFTDNFNQPLLDIGLYVSNSFLFHGRINDFQVSAGVARPHVVPTGPLPIF